MFKARLLGHDDQLIAEMQVAERRWVLQYALPVKPVFTQFTEELCPADMTPNYKIAVFELDRYETEMYSLLDKELLIYREKRI